MLLFRTYKQMPFPRFSPVMRLLTLHTIKPINKQESNIVQVNHQSTALIKCEKVYTGTHPNVVTILILDIANEKWREPQDNRTEID